MNDKPQTFCDDLIGLGLGNALDDNQVLLGCVCNSLDSVKTCFLQFLDIRSLNTSLLFESCVYWSVNAAHSFQGVQGKAEGESQRVQSKYLKSLDYQEQTVVEGERD